MGPGNACVKSERELTGDRCAAGFAGETIALACTALALGVLPAAWMAHSAGTAWLSANASFDERFLPPPPAELLAPRFASSLLDRSAIAAADIRAMQAKELLAQQLQSADWQSALNYGPAVNDEPDTSSAPGVPLPKARPMEANLANRNVASMPASGARRATSARCCKSFPICCRDGSRWPR